MSTMSSSSPVIQMVQEMWEGYVEEVGFEAAVKE